MAKDSTATTEPTEVAIVRAGRTVDVPIGRRVHGYDSTKGVEVYGPVYRTFKPGEEVTLAISEIARLRALGFLVDPNGTAVIAPDALSNRTPEHWPSRHQEDH
jgi:hypothetical protein